MKSQTTQINSWIVPGLLHSKEIQASDKTQSHSTQTKEISRQSKEIQTSSLVTSTSTQVGFVSQSCQFFFFSSIMHHEANNPLSAFQDGDGAT